MFAPALFGWCTVLVATSHAAPLSPDVLVRAALQTDAEVVAAEARLTAARGELAQARGPRVNPTLSGAASLTSDQLDLEVHQPVHPLEGLQRARAAEAAMRAAELERQRARLEAAAEARALLAQAIAASQIEALSAELLQDARARQDLAARRAAAGDGSALEARLARLELASAAQAAVTARREADALRVQLAALLPEGADLELPDDPRLVVPAARPTGAARLDVSAATARLDAAEASVRAARAAALPALDLGAFAERDDGDWSLGPSLSLTVPLWQTSPAERAWAAGDRAAAAAALARVQATATAEARLREEAAASADQTEATLGADPLRDATEALAAIDGAVAAGDLDRATASLLRAEVREGAAAALALRASVAQVRLEALLAADDPALLPAEVTP